MFAAAFYYTSKLDFSRTWLLRLFLWSLPLPWIAAELGWFVAEYGRQPWAIDGVLPTFLASSSVSTAQILFTLCGFVLFYSSLAVVDFILMRRYVVHGAGGGARPGNALKQRQREGAKSMSIPVDYDILRVIWWLFLGVLLIGFAIMDGFDLGVAALLPYVARNDSERRVAINTIGPVWEGNQVWLITGGGAIFAAFPPVYAASFSGFYIAMFLVLATLILRPVGFEFRNKIADHALARVLGLRAVCRRPGAVAGVRRGVRQHFAGRAVPHR